MARPSAQTRAPRKPTTRGTHTELASRPATGLILWPWLCVDTPAFTLTYSLIIRVKLGLPVQPFGELRSFCTLLYMTVPISEARATLPELVDRVASGDEIVLTRHGRPVAVLVHPTALRARRAEGALDEAQRLGGILAEAKASKRANHHLSATRADELIAHIDAGRNA